MPHSSFAVVGLAVSAQEVPHLERRREVPLRQMAFSWEPLTAPAPGACGIVKCRQWTLRAVESTRCAQGLFGADLGGMVASDVDRKCEWPRRPAWQPGGATRANDLVMGVGWPAAYSFETGGGDVIRVPVPARAHTAPRRGLSDLAGRWPFDGVFVLSGYAPAHASVEGVGVT